MVMTPLPPQGPNQLNTPISLPTDREQRDISRLRRILETDHAKPTLMSASDFKKFAPLFQKPNENLSNKEQAIFEEKIRKLTDEYIRKIDMYKEVHIVDQQGTVLLRIPPLFVQFSSLSPTKENDDAVLANRKLSRSDIPRFRDQALARLNEALINQQKSADQQSRIAEVTQQTHALLDDFFSKKLGIANTTSTETAPVEESRVEEEPKSFTPGKCIDL